MRPSPICAAPLLAVAASVLLAGCATPRAGGSAAAFPAPAALTMSGIPPVPAELPARIGRYTEFRGVALAGWSPDGQRLLVSTLAGPAGAQRAQLHEVAAPGAALRQITHAAEPTRSGRYLPADDRFVILERDAGGNEATRVMRLDRATGAETSLTGEGQRCSAGPFTRDGAAVLVTCAPVDRAGSGNVERAGGVSNTLLRIDAVSGAHRTLATLPGTGWWAADVSADGARVLLNRYRSAADTEVWQLDLPRGERHRLLPRDGEPAQFTIASNWAPDERRVLLVTDRFGEFRQAYRYDPQTHRFEGITADVPWDVRAAELSRDRRRLALITNEGGVGVARAFDAATLRPLAVPELPGLNVTRVALSPDGTRLALSATSASAPSDVRVIALPGAAPDASGTPQLWAAADTAGIDTRRFSPIERIEWTSFDGRTISGLIQRPPPHFRGPRPVLIDIHGGPEAQATLAFNGRYNYLVNELGIAFIEPNVRGSTGFGRTFHQLDNGRLREDAVRDIGALLDWIARQPDLDAARVVVQGASYGGYMALATAVHYPDRIRGAIPTVGISHFVSFLERTESYRRDLRRAEYGDERDPAMREFLHLISPLTNAHRIRVPLLVIHGRNDPRVPVQEAERIAATVAGNGVPVWLLIAENEGHGFAKKENADYAFYVRTKFLERTLLAPH
jgi:dipeptidyl aminopeptidase/acylaminoacyl peptidase